MNPELIRVSVKSIDGFSQTRTFKTLKGAQRYAQKRIGLHPEISEAFQYAVGTYGDVTLRVRGAKLSDLFPDEPSEAHPGDELTNRDLPDYAL